ncbi:hypothetical protein ACQ4PT_042794 [Festuca glaucescens]
MGASRRSESSRPSRAFVARGNLLPYLELRADLPVHFIDEKAVTVTDLDARQSRFRLPNHGVLRNLRPILTAKERRAANLQTDRGGEAGETRRGSSGLPVLVVDTLAGIIELEMSRLESGGGTSIKGEGYMDFITNCSFTVGDVVQIWAFKPRFSPLYLVIAKKPKPRTLS